MQELNFESVLELIVAKDPRYHRDAYLFVKDALDYTQKIVARQDEGKVRHVTGQELLAGIREFGLSQFGPMTQMVFAEWGVKRGEDFGEIVFNLVEIGLLGKTEQDSRDDFQNSYDFYEAFRKPYLPSGKPAQSEGVPNSAEA